MREKVQPVIRSPQPGAPVAVGKLPTSETGNFPLPPDPDSPAQNGVLPTPASDGGIGADSGAGKAPALQRGGLPARMLIALIKVYQKTISPWLPCRCRFEPTCSHYAVEALSKHGFFRGSALTVWRLLRCQPFSRGGYDPVPPPSRQVKEKKR